MVSPGSVDRRDTPDGGSAPVAPPPALPFDARSVSAFRDSTAALSDVDELRRRAIADGYLFFRGFLDPAPIFELRRAVLETLARHGLRASEADPLSGKLDLSRLGAIPADELRRDIGVSRQIYFELQQLPLLHRLPHHPSLLEFYRRLFDEEVFVHPRHIMRAMTPHPAGGITPPHQDFPFVQGSADTWTCWFPIGDCPIALGPLAILSGSHHSGYLPWGTSYGQQYWKDIGIQLCPEQNAWVSGDFAAGDVVTFPCFTVHRAVPPAIRDEIRISMDIRYQRASDVIHESSLTNHAGRPWDAVYEGWPAEHDDLKYYWQRERFSYSPWDASLLQPGAPRIC